MIDIVFPNNNEKEFVRTAKKLGYSGLCLVYYEKDARNLSRADISEGDTKIFTGIVCKKFPKQKADLYLAERSDRGFLKGSHDIIFGIEGFSDPFHQRDSGLNHILCKMMHENDATYGISFSSILNSVNPSQVLGRIMQNIRLCQKYKTPIAIASFAKQPMHMRSPNDLEAFGRVLGLRNAKKAIDNVSSCIMSRQKFFTEGINRR